jgi:hypothetical protein
MTRDCFAHAVSIVPPALAGLVDTHTHRFPTVAGEAALALLMTNISLVDSGYLGGAERAAAFDVYLQFLCHMYAHSGPRLVLVATKAWSRILQVR